MRPYITKIIAVLILIGAYYGSEAIKGSKKKNKPQVITTVPTAFVTAVNNKSIPVSIVESGRLSARYKIDLFAEVQGVMETTPKEFKPGAIYRKGDVLVKIKNDDYYANLQAQKSVLQNLITSMLPDLKLDYPDAFAKWDAYLKDFNMNKPIADLPEPSSDKEKFFLTGKNIYTTYYTTKNLEIILSKYTLKAPFNGIVTEALVTPGSLVRNGQKLGEFINPKEYELELAIGKALIQFVEVGKQVVVSNPENTEQIWLGEVSRINGKVNSSTQTIQIFISLEGEYLKEGMYLEANISGQERMNALEVSRNSLIDDNKMYVVGNDSILRLTEVKVVHKSRTKVIVQGVENNTWILSKPIPGAYVGMKVNVKQN